VEFEVRLLGRFLVRRDGREIPPASYQGRLVRTLLRGLVSRRAAFVSRDFLVEALWPDHPPADPERNLNVMVARARRALGDGSLILTGPGGYCFDPARRCYVDAEDFSERVQAARAVAATGSTEEARAAFSTALELWTGDPLTEDADADWALEYRASLFTLRQEALERAAEAGLAGNDPLEAVAWAQQAVAQQPLREAPHSLLARALHAAADTAGALKVISAFRSGLAEALGLDPSRALEELELSILRGEAQPAEPAPRRPAASPGTPFQSQLPFVGREGELESLLGVLQAEHGGILLVAGASGSGKSRLLEQARQRHPGPLATAAAFLGERDEPWSLARTLVREALSIHPDAVKGLSHRAVAALAEVVPELDDLTPLPRESTDRESRRALAMEAAFNLLSVLSDKGIPFIVDDLQWADPTSLVVLGQLARRTPELSMVLAFRPEEVGANGAVARFLTSMSELAAIELTVGDLSADAIGMLIAEPELAQVAITDTDRSPLAVAELIRALFTDGAIAPTATGAWAAQVEGVVEIARAQAQAGQRKAFVRRVQRLDDRLRRLMRIVALLGRPAPARLLASANRCSELQVLDDLEALTRLGLIRLTDSGWDTAHDLIAESLSEALEREEKAGLHALIATALSAEKADPREQAAHEAAAGDRQAAAESFVRAGTQSLDSFASEEAERCAELGLALDPTPGVRSALLEIRAEARMRRGLLKEARRDLRTALPAKKTGAERSRILSKLALLISGSEDYFQAGELAALAVTEAGADRGARARALAVGSMVAGNLHQLDRAHDLGMEALALFREVEDAEGIADMLELKALHTLGSGHLKEAGEELGQVRALFENSGKLLRIGQPRCLLGMCLVMEGRAEEALAETQQALGLSRALGHPEGIALAQATTSMVLVVLGRVDEAVEAAKSAVATARELSHTELTAISLLSRGLALEAANDLPAAEQAFLESLEAARKVPTFLSFAAARLCRLLVHRGELERAERYVSTALESASPFALFEGRLAQAELAAARGDPEAAAIAAEALRVAIAEGHLMSVPRLSELAGEMLSA
jgi:DNA-binding SARP family transcriptional activator/tetratricopeptide (TPR) repeat protein